MLMDFNFDVRSFVDPVADLRIANNPSTIGIQVFRNGVNVFTDDNVTTGLTIAWEDVTVSLGSGANFKSELGSTDTFEVRLFAHDISEPTPFGSRIALDNVRINGAVIPEPSGVTLAGLGLIAFGARRRR